MANQAGQTTDSGWTTKYLEKRKRFAKNLTFEIEDIMRDIRNGDYQEVDRDALTNLSATARLLVYEINKMLGADN